MSPVVFVTAVSLLLSPYLHAHRLSLVVVSSLLFLFADKVLFFAGHLQESI
eukprot:m.35921 g.35921  ORF g.35921 m.35921 type:complete len:51 (-) comp44361_c0_seq1:10-162(-)